MATLALLIATVLTPTQAQSKVYFSAFLAEGGTGVQRAGFDGRGLQTLQSEPTGFEDGLALDPVDGKMYWTDTEAGVISSANMNGSETQIVIDDSGLEPLGIALDVAGGKIYWTDSEGVKRANLNGSERQLLTKEPARGFLALDLTARRIYWADWPSGDVKTAAIAPVLTVTNVVTKQPAPFGIAVDHVGGKVYWLQLNLSKKKSENNVIRRANLSGTEVRTLIERPGAGFEGGLAIDPAAGKLYWGEGETHDIAVSNLDGSQARTLLGTDGSVPEGLAVETTEPHPSYTAAPVIEGSAQVGSRLRCNPGSWTGVGPLFLDYQWATPGGAVEGAIGSTYVPASEDAGDTLVCVVTATDNVETTTATSAGLKIAAYPSAVVTQHVARLVAGIAYSTLRSTGTRARVPVFTSAAGIATLNATPIGRHLSRKRSPRSKGRSKPIAITEVATQRLMAGRALITLKRLVPGVSYRLALTIRSADGQTATDTATLKVVKR